MSVSASSRSLARALALCAAFLAAAGPVSAQTGAGTYAAPFLKIPVGARLMSSPDAVAGLRPDATLMYSNPAFLSGLERTAAFVSTAEWLDNLVFSAAGVGLPIGDGSTVLGFGTTFLYSGGLNGYNDALSVVSSESYYNVGLDATVAHSFRGTGISLALGATYLREHVYPQDGSGFAFHGGLAYWQGPNLLHVSARDLGSSITYDSGTWDVAPEFVIGGGRVFDSRVGQFFTGAQVATSDAYGTRVQFGVDYQVNMVFTLRSGVTNNIDIGEAIPFKAGFGLYYGDVNLEYAYTPQEFFSSTHTFSLLYSFGMGGRSAGAPVTVPAGDFAPPVARSEPVPPPMPVSPKTEKTELASVYVLVAGSHAWLESARAEARALELLKIPAKIESEGTRFRVVIGRYDTAQAASRAQAEYRSQGHVFTVVTR